ncbi:MAG: hypothetical protein IJS93_01265 [Clostridia bacterium]|nr:hypothetical protein [Clostridia bacterium]
MVKKKVLCFGDSNTWGYIPNTPHHRYDEDTRWTRLLSKSLEDYEIIEEGLCSRTLFSNDPRPDKAGKRGIDYLKPCLDTHDKIDIVVFSVGTNELADWYDHTMEDVLEMVKKCLSIITSFVNWDGSKVKLVVGGLPLIDGKRVTNDAKFSHAEEKSKRLNFLIKDYCGKNSIPYIDNDDLKVGDDGVHYTAESHKKVYERLLRTIKEL